MEWGALALRGTVLVDVSAGQCELHARGSEVQKAKDQT